MAFYTPTWVRKLLKEEAQQVADHVRKYKWSKDGTRKEYPNDFRSYVDTKMPFVLFLDIKEIEEKVIAPNSALISSYVKHAFPDTTNHISLIKDFEVLLISCYKQVINEFIKDSNYTDIDAEGLSTILLGLNDTDNIREYLNTHFKKKYRVTNVTKQNISVMLLTPSFTSLNNFGPRFTSILDAELKKLSDNSETIQLADGSEIPNPYYILQTLVSDKTGKVTGKKQQFTTQLHNIGHVEVDVISEVDETKGQVKRGQLSPRFIQALVSVPKKAVQDLSLQFSEETGQVDTRIQVRKRFSGKKLVFEMLVEYGFPVGIPESQITNLRKAGGELGFGPGKGLTELIRNDKENKILTSLETSKSVLHFLAENVISIVTKGKQVADYVSLHKDAQSSNSFKIVKVKSTKLPKSKGSIPTKNRKASATESPQPTLNLTNLQNLLNQRLHDQIKANMGTGSARNVLNYRSGRFAQSAKVERMSESRAGMLTAFYTYMKYPYATFSEGGRQQYPKTRDPKLLIAKSIREIAGTSVSNRMRQVNI